MSAQRGFTTFDAWKVFFDEYFDRIRSIDVMVNAFHEQHNDADAWIKEYQKKAKLARVMYTNSNDKLEYHLYYYVNHPEKWTKEVADPLLAYLYRYCTRFEDVESAYLAAKSMHHFYLQQNDEIAIMKIYMIYAICYVYLDTIHFGEEIYHLSVKGIALLEKYYDTLSDDDISLALSFYDYQNNVLTLANNKKDIQKNHFIENILLPKYHASITMLNRFMKQADMNQPLNQILPFFKKSWTNNLFYYILQQRQKDIDKDSLSEIIALAEHEYMQSLENRENEPLDYIRDRSIYQVLKCLYYKRGADEVFAEMMAFWEELPKKKYTSWEEFDIAVSDTYLLLAFLMTGVVKEDKEKQKYLAEKLSELINMLYVLDYNNYLEYIVDFNSYIYLVPLMKYLPNEKTALEYLLRMSIFRQPQTAVHSIIVGKCARTILEYMLKDVPEYFVGLLNTKDVEQVKAKQQEFLDYIMKAALVHDVGKILCVNVINMQYRKLIDLEYQTIQFHPVTSAEILAQIPMLKCYYDIAVGHHKTYDDAYGYPQQFLTKNSDQKIFIDLIAICDSLDAATDSLGRNYAKAKHFDTVMQEFAKMKGTRYSPIIIDYILGNEELQKKLADHVEKEREKVYIEVYEVINKNSKKQEEKIWYMQ